VLLSEAFGAIQTGFLGSIAIPAYPFGCEMISNRHGALNVGIQQPLIRCAGAVDPGALRAFNLLRQWILAAAIMALPTCAIAQVQSGVQGGLQSGALSGFDHR
jgi:hypothetical protein